MHRYPLAVFALVAVVACSKKKDDAAPAATAAKPVTVTATVTQTPAPPTAATPTAAAPPATAPAAAPPSGTCPPGAWKNDAKDQPQVCIQLPKGYALHETKQTSHHEWRYEFRGEGDYRPSLSVTVLGIAKPAVASLVSSAESSYETKVSEEAVPNGTRIVTHSEGYDKDEYGMETEHVFLSKSQAVDVSKECGSCPPWEWAATCYSSTAKQAAPEDRNACKTFQMP